jgi:hypothetical protein
MVTMQNNYTREKLLRCLGSSIAAQPLPVAHVAVNCLLGQFMPLRAGSSCDTVPPKQLQQITPLRAPRSRSSL